MSFSPSSRPYVEQTTAVDSREVPMSDPQPLPTRSRRTVLNAAAWSVPVVMVASPAPAMAATPPEQQFGVVFDGGGGTNGLLNSTYLNLYSTTGKSITLTQPVTLTVDVVGLTGSGTAERSFSASSSNGTTTRSAYNSTTRTTRLTWTLPVGTVVPTTKVATANPDILFSFGDGGHSGGRITNKIVVRSISGGRITAPSGLPIDSTVVKDYDQKAASPDGIY